MSNTATAQTLPIPQFKLHHRLALTMEEAGVTTEQMADALGVHVNSVTNYTSGRRVPKRSVIKVWALRCGHPELWHWIETGNEANSDPDKGFPLSRWVADRRRKNTGEIIPFPHRDRRRHSAVA